LRDKLLRTKVVHHSDALWQGHCQGWARRAKQFQGVAGQGGTSVIIAFVVNAICRNGLRKPPIDTAVRAQGNGKRYHCDFEDLTALQAAVNEV
jgi:hypothetical protein